MTSSEGIQLAETINRKLAELSEVCEGIDEETASRAPSGRWSPKQILSHISGPDGIGLMPAIMVFLEQETPRLDLEAANPFFSEKRSHMTLAQLLSEVKKEYGNMADLVAKLSEAQLARTAWVPLFKETPMGEYPTLAVFVRAMAEHHLDFHIAHMKEILAELRG